jgi:hypothetical protein
MRLYSYFALLLPLVIMLLSWGISSLIPGCTIDEGAGASSACGAIGPLLAMGTMGGFLWLLFGIFGLIPALLVNAWTSRKSREPAESNYCLRAIEAEAKKKNAKK